MNTSLEGKNVLVCGASQGIGEAVAKELAASGASVTLLARNIDKLNVLKESLPHASRHQAVSVDLSDQSSIVDAVSPLLEKAPFHILINNAGGPKGGPIVDAQIEEFEMAFRTHVLASQTLVQLLSPGMIKDGYGRVVNVISTSVKAPIANLGVSNTIRGAMGNWAKTMSLELGKHGITVNNVLPGFTDTQRLSSLKEAAAKRLGKTLEEMHKAWLSTIPLGRLADPSETANAVAFLASPAASYINGINLPVDGGRTPSL